MRQKNIFPLLAVFVLAVAVFMNFNLAFVNADNSYQQNYSVSASGNPTSAQFVLQALKYEPYPVIPGEWFDVWVKAENIGQNDAQSAVFELLPQYPFESNDSLVRNYGLIPGTVNAYKIKLPSEQNPEENQVIMKFRVKAEDNAPAGTSILKIKMSSDANSAGFVYNLPIEIEKSDIDFEVVMQSSNPLSSSFTIGNIGSNSAGIITVKLNPDQWNLNGDVSYDIGNLNNGDFSRFTIQGSPKENVKSVSLEISYTDVSGVRHSITKNVPVLASSEKASVSNLDKPYLKWIFALVGVFVGVLIVVMSRKVHHKHRR
jgi:hypothetical protein